MTAAVFGAGDFAGGLSAKRTRVVEVVLGSHFVGLVGVTGASLILADRFTGRDFALGALAGAFGGLGVGLLYRGLSRGPMAVVAPLTAITSAAVPAAWGAVSGEAVGVVVWIGVAVALVAIGFISLSPGGVAEPIVDVGGVAEPIVDVVEAGPVDAVAVAPRAPVTAAVVFEALVSGMGFGAFFIVMDATDGAAAPWPVVSARLLTTVVLATFLLTGGGGLTTRRWSTIALIALTGSLDSLSNVLFLFAADLGDLTVVSVLTSLYPASTVILARVVLGERMHRIQGLGFVLAMAATILIALG